jgi:ABC-2 type transport system permease protein
MRTLELRGDFFFWMGVSAMWTVFNIFFFDVLVGVSGSIAGWNRYEMWVLLGAFSMLDAFTWSFFYYNMQNYSNGIFTGELNRMLTLPIDTQFLLMSSDNNFSNILRFFLGIGTIVAGLMKLGVSVGPLQVLGFILSFLATLCFIYFFWFFLSTFAFYVERLNNLNEIIPTIRRAWQVPRQVYTGGLSLLFSTLIPLGLLTSVPAEVLLGKPVWSLVLYLWFAAVVMMLISRVFFAVSIKRMAGAGN